MSHERALRLEGGARWPSVLAYPYPGEETEPEPVVSDMAARLAAADTATGGAANGCIAGDVEGCGDPRRRAIEVRLCDQHEHPVAGATVELRNGDGKSLLGRTDVRGDLRFEGLEPGSYALSLPDVDAERWTLEDSERMEDAEASSRAKAEWSEPPPTTGPTQYEVQPGEGLSEIAARHGFGCERLWEANAALRQQRPHPNVLAPGDVVEIPALQVEPQRVEAGSRVRVRRFVETPMLQLRFLDGAGEARADVPYLLTLHGSGGGQVRDGRLDADGQLDEPMLIDTERVTLELGAESETERYELLVNHLDPLDRVSGVQARLRSLGLLVHDEDEQGELGPRTVRALRDLQREAGIPETGALDDATVDALEELHLC
ncbi:MAG: peptidoglycan-binding protein [Myxococcota bacterium]